MDINLKGFKATVTGAGKRVKVRAEFMNTVLTVDSSLEFARMVVHYAPMISLAVMNKDGKAGIEAAKKAIEQAIKDSGG